MFLRPRRLARLILVSLLSSALAVEPVLAQDRGINLVRDAEIEHTLRVFATPIFRAAGIVPDAVTLVLVNDDELNAFVAGGQNMFVNTGLIMAADTPEQLIGVMAHETGHMAGGHQVRSRDAIENAVILSTLATLLSVAAAIGGTRRGDGGGAAMGGIAGAQELGARSFFAFSRAQEASADEAGLSYMEANGYSSKGMLEFMEKLRRQDAGLPQTKQVEFLMTHPLTKNRVEYIENFVDHISKFTNAKMPSAYYDMHQRMRAKLYGFIHPDLALRKYPESDTSVPARYARSIAYYQVGDINKGLKIVDGLIEQEPKNPYFYELKGQILFENGRAKEAVDPYRNAVKYAPDSAQLRMALGHALLEAGDDKLVREAIDVLRSSARDEPLVELTWLLLASAYARADMAPQLAYARAEEALARGDIRAARYHADRAEQMLPAGSPDWVRAQDIRVLVESRLPHNMRPQLAPSSGLASPDTPIISTGRMPEDALSTGGISAIGAGFPSVADLPNATTIGSGPTGLGTLGTGTPLGGPMVGPPLGGAGRGGPQPGGR
ncbi:M48 family metalloprotease [Nitrospirillum amazonense]|uniref:Putative Zn-dependent protease n=1 Tax=Nitrospirillum amazonense TaxID=28077 RepID=A0A560KIF5_9PROT|nr:M48 family metalloprotease [Nitrospirillum amazonense]MDG3444408.1 M48 family metalloprotease [Nitrospirillum amazonense]TWB82987.1 putative Zn-dependent protease [Nitrospirillum amazonense]